MQGGRVRRLGQQGRPSQRTFDCCKSARTIVKHAAQAFHLRKLIVNPFPLTNRYEALNKQIYDLFCANSIEICISFDNLVAQYGLLECTLQAAAKELPFRGTGTTADDSDDSPAWLAPAWGAR